MDCEQMEPNFTGGWAYTDVKALDQSAQPRVMSISSLVVLYYVSE